MIINQYKPDPEESWFKGNLHTHTSEGSRCAPHGDKHDIVQKYKHKGYDFLALTDHNNLTRYDDKDIFMLTGAELGESYGDYSNLETHLLAIGISDDNLEKALRFIDAKGYKSKPRYIDRVIDIAEPELAVLCHPGWSSTQYYSTKEILKMKNIDGMEIYNYLAYQLGPTGLSVSKWDEILRRGKILWGFGNDDAHKPSEAGFSYNVVLAKTVDEVIPNMKKGRFYVASKGMRFEIIDSYNDLLYVKVPKATQVTLINQDGIIYKKADWSNHGPIILEYKVDPKKDKYVRIEAFLHAEREYPLLFSQPLFIK